jgi:ABC-type antimicrobial peptide transport system ATPase subunit
MTRKTINIEKALLDPTMIFNNPQEVLNHSELLKQQKIEILERWQYDATELEIADDENMLAANNKADILDEILAALNILKY